MTKTKKVKAAGRYGARYGVRVRRKITEIENLQRKKQKCIFCGKKAKRLSKGIWKCQKCNKKFASHAYYLPIKEEVTLNIK
ncbi:MAG: 50S ribosomal protein L37ae [Nanoarchaeota archaeon]|nr:50S ribosomal protein L37ae [Nanoarchaeota archaeon]